MKELIYTSDWGGGSFNFTFAEVKNKMIFIRTSENKDIGVGIITKEVVRYGEDYDHGRVEQWKNVDYVYSILTDDFDRNTKILDLLNRGFLIFLKDE